MVSIIAALGTAAISLLAGEAIGGVLARLGIAGFGRLSRRVLLQGKALRLVYETKPTQASKKELIDWVKRNDPNRETSVTRDLDV